MQKLTKYSFIIFLLLLSQFTFAQSFKAQLAQQYFQNQEFDKAVEIYKELYEENPTEYYNSYATCLEELKNFKELEKIIKKQIKKNPANLGLLVRLGNIYAKQNEPDKAQKEYEKAINNLTAEPQQAIDLGKIFINFKQFDLAEKVYLKARKLNKNDYPYSFELAEVYNNKGDYEAMINEYLQVIDDNEAYVNQVKSIMQTNIGEDSENKKKSILKAQLIKRVNANSNTTVFSDLLIWYYVQDKDFEQAFIQSKAIDKRRKEDGQRIISLADICRANKDYETAINCYNYILLKGKESPYHQFAKIELVNTMNDKIVNGNYTTTDLTSLETTYETTLKELGRSAETVNLIIGLSKLQAFYLGKTHDAEINLKDALSLNVNGLTNAETKILLADVLLMQGDMWEPALLYGQVEKAYKEEAIGHEAKYKNAKLSFYKGDFEWAQAQLDVLKASTSKLIANDALYFSLLIMDNTVDSNYAPLMLFAKADLLFFQHKNELAYKTLDSITTEFPGHSLADDILYKKAQIEVSNQNYTQAIGYLEQLTKTYLDEILTDDAIFTMADLYENKLNDKTKASALYEEIILKHTGSIYVVEARKRFRILRGDKVN